MSQKLSQLSVSKNEKEKLEDQKIDIYQNTSLAIKSFMFANYMQFPKYFKQNGFILGSVFNFIAYSTVYQFLTLNIKNYQKMSKNSFNEYFEQRVKKEKRKQKINLQVKEQIFIKYMKQYPFERDQFAYKNLGIYWYYIYIIFYDINIVGNCYFPIYYIYFICEFLDIEQSFGNSMLIYLVATIMQIPQYFYTSNYNENYPYSYFANICKLISVLLFMADGINKMLALDSQSFINGFLHPGSFSVYDMFKQMGYYSFAFEIIGNIDSIKNGMRQPKYYQQLFQSNFRIVDNIYYLLCVIFTFSNPKQGFMILNISDPAQRKVSGLLYAICLIFSQPINSYSNFEIIKYSQFYKEVTENYDYQWIKNCKYVFTITVIFSLYNLPYNLCIVNVLSMLCQIFVQYNIPFMIFKKLYWSELNIKQKIELVIQLLMANIASLVVLYDNLINTEQLMVNYLDRNNL